VAAQTAASKFNLMKTIPIHTAPVHSVTMSKDSEVIATASWDQTCKLYELSTGRVIRTLGEGVDPDQKMNGLYAVAFAKTQDNIMGCTSCDKSVYLWDHQKGVLLNKLTGHTNEVNGIDFHTTQQVMATASDDKTCVIWDFQEAIQLRTLDKHTQAVYGCVFLGQENQYFVATCCFDRNTRVFDMRDKSVVACLQVHEDDVIGIDYSSPKQLLATGSDDGKICIWDTRQWRLQKTIDTKLVNPEDENEVKRVAFSPNGNLLAAACSSNKVLVYDVENDGKLVDVLATHSDCVFDICWGLNPNTNKKRLVSASHDHTVCFWEEA
jgi:WD40 repeat protein